MECILVRHPPVAVDSGICYGQLDVPIKGSPEPWVARIQTQIPHWQDMPLWSSDLSRCKAVAEILGNPMEDPRLRELNFGQWEGQAWIDLPREQTEWWSQDIEQRKPPAGESFSELKRRAQSFLDDFQTDTHPILAITHAGFIRAVLAQVMDMNADQVFRFGLDYGSISIFNFDKNGWQLVSWNG